MKCSHSTRVRILFILSNISQSYKDLAEYFSRKSKKFNYAAFEKIWIQLCNRYCKQNSMIYKLHIMAKKDNPEKYELHSKKSVLNNLIENLIGFLTVCETLVSTPPGVPIVPLNEASSIFKNQLNVVQSNLEKLKSETVKTI